MSSQKNHNSKEGHPGGGKVITKQAPAQEADINHMVRRHLGGGAGRTLAGIGDPRATRQPRFGDMPSESFHEMMNSVTSVQTAFMSLTAKTRARFANSPYQLLRWVEDPRNQKEAVKLGFIDDPEVVQAVREAEAAADREAQMAAQEAAGQGNMLKPDPEAQPPYTPPKGGTTP